MIEGLLDNLATGGLFGGITGLAGTIWSSYNKRKLAELEMSDRDKQRQHDRDMVKAESDAMIAESRAEVEMIGTRVAGAVDLAETEAFAESLEAGQGRSFDASYMDRLFAVEGWLRFLSVPAGVLLAVFFGTLDLVKGFARPGITFYLLGISTWITIKAWDLLGRINQSAITATTATDIISDAIAVIFYLTVTAVTWWFGDRMAAKGMAKNLKLRGV
ncbi:MAG: hypothetical protein MI863_16480 [Desulfobacterales bacterium]|nr:hypothetical protein [Desulfobacterales bacterium]